jgi:hypothetical protein
MGPKALGKPRPGVSEARDKFLPAKLTKRGPKYGTRGLGKIDAGGVRNTRQISDSQTADEDPLARPLRYPARTQEPAVPLSLTSFGFGSRGRLVPNFEIGFAIFAIKMGRTEAQ